MDDPHAGMRYEPPHPSLRKIAMGLAFVAASVAIAIGIAGFFVDRSGTPARAPGNAMPPAIEGPVLETAPRKAMDDYRRAQRLAAALDGKPGVVVRGYLGCRDLCPLTLAGALESLRASGLEPGRAYRGVFESIDPADDAAALAAARVARVPEPERAAWRFIPAGGGISSARIEHASGIEVVNAAGARVRGFNGVRFDPAALRGAIEAAARGDPMPGIAERFVMWCSHLDPLTGRHSATILAVLRIAAVAGLAAAGLLLWARR